MIYLDNAASAPIKQCALSAAMPFLSECCANPSSSHGEGRRAALAVINAREQCAAALSAKPSEIFFTSGGTESDNWALFAAAEASGKRHIVTTAIEHPAVLNTCRALEKRGFFADYILPDNEGIISPDKVAAAISDHTAIVSVMAANNEIGTIQPIAEIGAICREKGVLFHTDAVQAAGSIPLDPQKLNIDMLSVSGHKLGGLKGSGLLYVRDGTKISPLIFGGGQERKMRSGTENVAAIVSLGAAMENAFCSMEANRQRISAMRDELISRLEKIPHSRLNGSRKQRLCGNVNFSFLGVEGESLVLNLDLMGICASSGSACASGKTEHSHVLRALGLAEEWQSGSLRLSISENNTMDEIIRAAEVVAQCIERLRAAVK